MSQTKIVRIEIEYSDGRILQALEGDAEAIMRAYSDGLRMMANHGVPYRGPVFKEVKPVQERLR